MPVLALLGLCLGPAAAVTPLVIWHGMGEPGPSANGPGGGGAWLGGRAGSRGARSGVPLLRTAGLRGGPGVLTVLRRQLAVLWQRGLVVCLWR